MNEKSENDDHGFVSMGTNVAEQWKAAASTALTAPLRQDEVPLGNLSLADQTWLTTALSYLIQIDESRKAENVFGSAYCIFEVGIAYFQCLAPSFGAYLRCESVSEKFVPEIATILTRERTNRLLHEFDFTDSGYSGNFSRKIEIETTADLAYVARLAFRVLRDVYGVKDFGATKVKLSIPKPSPSIPEPVSLPVELPPEPSPGKPYAVFVDDNFHYQNEEERYREGDYATLNEAVSKCRSIVDDFLKLAHKPGMSSKELYEHYCSFGEDPFIRGPEAGFSAWTYAEQRCDELCQNQKDKNS